MRMRSGNVIGPLNNSITEPNAHERITELRTNKSPFGHQLNTMDVSMSHGQMDQKEAEIIIWRGQQMTLKLTDKKHFFLSSC